MYRQLGEGVFKAVMLDWRGTYPDPEAYLTPLLSCGDPAGTSADPVKPPSAAVSGPQLQETLLVTGSWGSTEPTLHTLETMTARELPISRCGWNRQGLVTDQRE